MVTWLTILSEIVVSGCARHSSIQVILEKEMNGEDLRNLESINSFTLVILAQEFLHFGD